MGFHYGKHHKAYVDNLNKLVAGIVGRLVVILAADADHPQA
ncbi:MAG: superoxide dismutase [Fe], partial [Prochlorococcaceae cyanobacterium]